MISKDPKRRSYIRTWVGIWCFLIPVAFCMFAAFSRISFRHATRRELRLFYWLMASLMLMACIEGVLAFRHNTRSGRILNVLVTILAVPMMIGAAIAVFAQ